MLCRSIYSLQKKIFWSMFMTTPFDLSSYHLHVFHCISSICFCVETFPYLLADVYKTRLCGFRYWVWIFWSRASLTFWLGMLIAPWLTALPHQVVPNRTARNCQPLPTTVYHSVILLNQFQCLYVHYIGSRRDVL